MLQFSTKYLYLLKTKFAGLNLTRILDDQEFYEKQILDSILPYEQCPLFKDELDKRKLMVDIGFGGGFPILPMAQHRPGVKFIGFESRSKKVDAVKTLASDLELNNVKVFHERLENILFDRPSVITLKAVGTVNEFLPMINASADITVYFYKGPSYMEKEHPEFLKTHHADWELVLNQILQVPGTDERRLVAFKPRVVPRGTIKNLVKLSSYL